MSSTKHRLEHQSSTRHALSLLDVVCAIAATAVLSGLTLAALGGARSTNQLEICLNNLRVIGAASAQYSADDPDEHAIPLHPKINAAGVNTLIGDYQYGGKSGRVNQPTDYIYTIEGGYRSLSRPLNYYLYDIAAFTPPECRELGFNPPLECREADKSLPLYRFRCPSDTGKTGLHSGLWGDSGRSGFDYFGTSYNANVFQICSGADTFFNSPFRRPRSDVPNPARTVQYMETCGRYAWAWGYSPWHYGTTFTVGGWHGDDWMFNAVFMDGSARYTRMKGASPNGTGIVDGPDDVEYVPGLPGGMNQWWRVITRGRDWQFDIFPATPVATNLRCSFPLIVP